MPGMWPRDLRGWLLLPGLLKDKLVADRYKKDAVRRQSPHKTGCVVRAMVAVVAAAGAAFAVVRRSVAES